MIRHIRGMLPLGILIGAAYMLYTNFDLVHETLSIKSKEGVESSLEQIAEQAGKKQKTDPVDPIMQEEIDTLRAERERIMRERLRIAREILNSEKEQ